MKIKEDVFYVGVDDEKIELFENQYPVPFGICYNSYVVLDEKIAVFDTVDESFTFEWLVKIKKILKNRAPDFLIVQHMEPDHSANIGTFMRAFPQCTLVASVKAVSMTEQFFGSEFKDRIITVKENDVLSLGSHRLRFIMAPMVHWPEVMVTFDEKDGLLFSADAFGRFGTYNFEGNIKSEMRRYYMGIVAKYGKQVQELLKKVSSLEIGAICPLHGQILSEKEAIAENIRLYNTWSSYEPEAEGITLVYSSIYSNTQKAAELLFQKCREKGQKNIELLDLTRCDMYEAIASAFRYSKLVIACPTYNNSLFPKCREFIAELTLREYQKREIGIIENGTWAPTAAKNIRNAFSASKDITFTEPVVTVKSALSDESRKAISNLADKLCQGCHTQSEREDNKALFSIGYGLYVVTSCFEEKPNGLILNTVSQVTNSPNQVAVTVSKANYSHFIIKETEKLNINCLTEDTPFSLFQNFGFRSGIAADKFENVPFYLSENGLPVLKDNINSYISLKVTDYVDLDTHGMFICEITDSSVINEKETVSYTYYQKNIKPKPEKKKTKGYVCKVCGYVYEGETLPEDFICPWCKHPASDFERI